MARRTRKIRTSHVHGTKKIVLHSQSENKWSSAPENFFPVIDPNLTAQTIQQAIHVEVKERISLPVRYPTGFPRTSHSGRWAVPCAPVSARRTCPEDSRVHSMVQPRSGGACRRLAWPPWTGIDRSWRKEAVGSTCVAQLQAWYPARSDRLPQRRASPACAAAPAKVMPARRIAAVRTRRTSLIWSSQFVAAASGGYMPLDAELPWPVVRPRWGVHHQARQRPSGLTGSWVKRGWHRLVRLSRPRRPTLRGAGILPVRQLNCPGRHLP